jgi:putative ABC transport system permease protein
MGKPLLWVIKPQPSKKYLFSTFYKKEETMIENIEQAIKGIFSHKMRSFLTMLGVIIGIAAIIAIVSIVEGTSKKLEKSLVGSGNNVTIVAPSEDGSYAYDMSSGIPTGFVSVNDSSLREIKGISGVRAASAYNTRDVNDGIYWKEKSLSYGAKVNGIDSTYLKTLLYKVTSGRDFSGKEYSSTDKIALVDDNLVNKLFDGANPLGQIIEVGSEPFKVVGVVHDSNKKEEEYDSIDDYYQSSGSESSYGNIYIPNKVWPIIYQFDEPKSVAVSVKDTKQMAAIGKKVSDSLNNYGTGDTVKYCALNSSQANEAITTLTNSITIMLVSIASLSLLVGGIGVMNIMLVSVTERTSEIGLKKALGAKKKNILAQFLTESAVLTGVGGILGVIVGIILAKILSVVISLDFAISVPWIIISVGFSIGIGILFGVTPANKAAKLNPIDALRRD